MLKIKNFIILITIYLIALFTLKSNINLFYPYFLLKDLIFYPTVLADDKFNYSNDFKDGIIKEMKKELEELKKINNISNTLSEFEAIKGVVIERNKMYWFNTILINIGTNQGIEKDMVVVSGDGLIGRINKVSKTTSEVKLLTTSDVNHKVSVVIKKDDLNIYGIMSLYNNETNYLEVTTVNKTNLDLTNSLVYTSGMGGIFPSGILIGEVMEIKTDKYEVSKVINVKPSADFNDIKFVSVLKRK